ncbi:hypothetical protein PGT21_026615 [Puccinia graminis f. sp. tritici]|uniref:Uncharacterized protein n=1 Tax=Puccinia graminis f. sp. tritici TaxID=56615 RepID=A0A5B0M5E0_PUCGR|nr:hypothetical protein PGT21_026615 [Puccinia graminis f. sp. tritici]
MGSQLRLVGLPSPSVDIPIRTCSWHPRSRPSSSGYYILGDRPQTIHSNETKEAIVLPLPALPNPSVRTGRFSSPALSLFLPAPSSPTGLTRIHPPARSPDPPSTPKRPPSIIQITRHPGRVWRCLAEAKVYHSLSAGTFMRAGLFVHRQSAQNSAYKTPPP